MSPRVVPGATWCGASPTVIWSGGGDGGAAGWQAAKVAAHSASTALHHAAETTRRSATAVERVQEVESPGECPHSVRSERARSGAAPMVHDVGDDQPTRSREPGPSSIDSASAASSWAST